MGGGERGRETSRTKDFDDWSSGSSNHRIIIVLYNSMQSLLSRLSLQMIVDPFERNTTIPLMLLRTRVFMYRTKPDNW